MTYLFAVGILFVLALIVIMTITSSQRKQQNHIAAAKLRSETRLTSKDVWADSVQVDTVIHHPEPIKYDISVHTDEDLTDSQYQVLKAIFAEEHTAFRTDTDHVRSEEDYWTDTDYTGISK